MPLVRIDLHQGRSEEELAAIGDVVHRAMVETIAVPADDRFQVLSEHPPGRLVFDRHYLGVERDDGIVLVQITLARGRSVEKKEASIDESPKGWRSGPGSRPGTCSSAWWRSAGRTGPSGRASPSTPSTPSPTGPRPAREPRG